MRSTLVREALEGCWRQRPPALSLSAGQLEEISPLLHGSGAAALVWWKARDSPLAACPAAQQLQQVWRLQVLRDAIFETEIQQVFAFFRSAGIEPILVKGWNAARFYAEPSLRPYGDIDLLVRPEQRTVAASLLETPEGRRHNIDLTHRDFIAIEGDDADEIYARSLLVSVGQSSIRVLGVEDHLRLLCTHLLRHGAWRPLWLCDVAAALESRPAGFDWDWCLRGNREAQGVTAAISLAHQLLRARVDDTPMSHRARHPPSWLVPAAVKQWGRAFYVEHPLLQPIWGSLRHPGSLPEALRSRWPDPIEATAVTGAPFNELPRVIFQVVACLQRATGFLIRLLKPDWSRPSTE